MGPLHEHMPELQKRTTVLTNQWAEWSIGIESSKVEMPRRFRERYHLWRDFFRDTLLRTGFLTEQATSNRVIAALMSTIAFYAAIAHWRQSKRAPRNP